MKTVVTLIAVVFTIGKVLATGQIPDYLIQGQDTVPIFNNPLEQYFDQVRSRKLIDYESSCGSSACWRGYVAFWELKNDSLFLLRITSCHEKCSKTDANLLAMFGRKKPFAYWYNGTLTIPRGDMFSISHGGYSAIFEYEDKIHITSGVVESKYQISNKAFIEQIKLDEQLRSHISNLEDTLLFYLSTYINWEKLDKSNNYYCWDSYVLLYHQGGKLLDVRLIKYVDDSTTVGERIGDWLFDKKCSKKIKAALNPLSLNYVQAHRDFLIEIDLFYGDHLEIWKCHEYTRPISNKEIQNYVRKQMDIKE